MQRADYEQAVEAARRWIAEHGRYPQQQEWEHRAPGRPTTRMIKRRWGWEELINRRGRSIVADTLLTGWCWCQFYDATDPS